MEEKRIVKLGVIGSGAFSNTQLDGISKADNCECIAIASIDEPSLKAQAEKFHIPSTYLDYKDLLAREDIEAVTICTNDQSHCQITCDALRAGKHVLCEKPMSLSLEECKEMIKVQKETGMLLMVGQIGRYTPCFNTTVELVRSGEIGEIFFVESEYAHDYSHIPGNGNWRKTPERHAIIGGGCHAVDLLRRIAGTPLEVCAYANKKVLTDWPVDDCTVAIMKFPNNVIGKVMCSIGCKRKYTMRTVVYGTKGTIIADSIDTHLVVYKDEYTADRPNFDKKWQHEHELHLYAKVDDHNFKGEVTDFANAVITGEMVDCTGVEGAITVAACTAIVESAAKDGEKVKVFTDF